MKAGVALLLILLTVSGLIGVSFAQEHAVAPAGTRSLRAGALTVTVNVTQSRFAGLRVHDDISGRNLAISEAFVVVLKDGAVLRSTEMQVKSVPDSIAASDPHRAVRTVNHGTQPSASSCWGFTSLKTTSTFQWCILFRPGSDYARELFRVTAMKDDLPIAEVRLLQFADPGARVDGNVKGSPVVDANLFFGIEHPLSVNTVENGSVKSSLFRDLPLRSGQTVIYSSVIGTSQPGKLRRAFLAYIERERPRPYQPFLHYNSWFDLGFRNRFDEAGAIDRVKAFGEHLVVERHVQLDSFLFDDGWDDPQTLWGFNSGFPNGFRKTEEVAATYKAGIGVWLSPWGGYKDEKKERIAYGRAHGYEILNDGYALSGPKYFERFQNTCLEMIDRYKVNQFKFDGTGNAGTVFPGSAFDSDFDAAIHLIERLRQQKPSIFINLTTGTTASPFWLFYADSIWRSGRDYEFSGVGSTRQKWITYRDAQTYKNVVLQGPLFPLNSVMLHGIIYANQAKDLAADPKNDFADEVHSYFGTGTQLQEMYITPSLLSKANWDALAEAARWSRSHASTLKDTHWIGGDPDQLEVYGWAAWTPQEGIITLRNPSSEAKTFNVDIAKLFELGPADPTAYVLHSVWADPKQPAARAAVQVGMGKTFPYHLAPFEVVTLEAIPASLGPVRIQPSAMEQPPVSPG